MTFFRSGLDPAPPEAGDSPLRARQAVAAHLAVAEVAAGRFRHAERVGRADGGFSGFASDDLKVWLGDWQLERRPDDALVARASDREAAIGVELSYRPVKPLVRQGVDGYSQKGADPGNASAYLSWTRLEVSGTLVLDGRELAVAGEGWFDHEWGSSQLGEGVAGWDWFSLRLDDGSELMVYRLRHEDGTPDAYSSGTVIRADGSTRRLAADEVVLEPTGWWTSPATGGRYPSGWRIAVPSEQLDLRVAPARSRRRARRPRLDRRRLLGGPGRGRRLPSRRRLRRAHRLRGEPHRDGSDLRAGWKPALQRGLQTRRQKRAVAVAAGAERETADHTFLAPSRRRRPRAS